MDGPNNIYKLHPEFLSLNRNAQWMYVLVRYYQLASTLEKNIFQLWHWVVQVENLTHASIIEKKKNKLKKNIEATKVDFV